MTQSELREGTDDSAVDYER